jgi:hypothetical protein
MNKKLVRENGKLVELISDVITNIETLVGRSEKAHVEQDKVGQLKQSIQQVGQLGSEVMTKIYDVMGWPDLETSDEAEPDKTEPEAQSDQP